MFQVLDTLWLLVIIYLSRSVSFSGKHLPSILNYSPRTENHSIKMTFIWSNPYKIENDVTWVKNKVLPSNLYYGHTEKFKQVLYGIHWQKKVKYAVTDAEYWKLSLHFAYCLEGFKSRSQAWLSCAINTATINWKLLFVKLLRIAFFFFFLNFLKQKSS